MTELRLAKPIQRMSPPAGHTQEEWNDYCAKWEASIYENNKPFKKYLLKVSEEFNKRPGVRTYVQQYAYQLGYFLKVDSWDGTDVERSWVQAGIQGVYRSLLNPLKFESSLPRCMSTPNGQIATKVFIQMLEEGEIQFSEQIHFNGAFVEA